MSDCSRGEILDFWFTGKMPQYWFSSTAEIDAEIRNRFQGTWKSARRGMLSQWKQSAEGALALTIVLDQFPLNMFRGQPQSFATEQQAVAVTKHAIAMEYHKLVLKDRLPFLYMPLMHSEISADQELSVRCFRSIGLKEQIAFAEHHRDIIRRFGRFPHRNAILGRKSTIEEIEYLSSQDAFKG